MPRPPARPTVISVLRSSTLLNSLSDEDLLALARVSHAAYAERGESIWSNGAEVNFIGLVGTGFVKMVKTAANGSELTHELMGPGQMFGLLGALEGRGCPLGARAVTHVWFVKIPYREFRPIYERTLSLRDHVLRRATLRLRQAQDQLTRVATGTVESRIAGVLMMLVESYGRPTEKGTLIDVPLTRQDIAEMAGTTVESTIRVVSKWQKSRLVASSSRFLTLLDESAIADLVHV
ncbi:MAG: Crp/Fnr family transcriptional regulator [Fimbriimonadaceae bacterium]